MSAPARALRAALLVAWLAPAAARAECGPLSPEQPLTLQASVERAARCAPAAEVLAARLRGAEGPLLQARTAPNPTVSYLAQDLGTPALLHQETLSYPILFAWTRSQEARVARAGLRQAQAAASEDRRQLRLAAGRAYYDLLLGEALADIEEEGARAAAAFAAATAQRAKSGDVGAMDVVRARAEEGEGRRLAEQARRRRDLDRLAFSILVGAEGPLPLRLMPDWGAAERALPEGAGAPEPDHAAAPPGAAPRIDALRARALGARPDLQAARAALARAEEQRRLEGRRAVPLQDVLIAGGARQGAAGLGGLVSVSAPLPLFDHNRGPRRQAAAAVEGARAALRQAERQAALDIDAAALDYRGAAAARDQILRPLCAAREQARAAAERQFAEGLTGLLDVLSAARDLVAARRALAQGERDAAAAAWRLALALAPEDP